ncbi:MAG TPA: M67 family metallopeptidase [Candidatus Competibacteraceae bacterium]|nr:M67 family metallopeptidase [Candidatus Competibacteraceae bacterium]
MNGNALSVLYLSAADRARIAGWAEQGYPLESCGVLIGRQEDGRCWVQEVRLGRNLNRERAHDRYELAPEDLLAADQAASAAGLEIVGIWHSHPDHPARPSETDRAHAWSGWSYVIVAVERGRAVDLRSWRLQGETFAEEELWQP